MAEQGSRGQQDKVAAEVKTAAVGADNQREKAAGARQATAAEKRQQAQADETPAEADERRAQLIENLDGADSAADRFAKAEDAGDSDVIGAVALSPYPAYEEKELGALKSAADARNVEINRDVEKAELVRLIRAKDPQNAAALDFMTLEQLRGRAGEQDVELGEEFVRAHLVTELRAADTGVKNSGDHVL
jgi:hypothetical protein